MRKMSDKHYKKKFTKINYEERIRTLKVATSSINSASTFAPDP